jgi:hypothetical protein
LRIRAAAKTTSPRRSDPGDRAAAFEEGDVAPAAVIAGDALAAADAAETGALVEPEAGGVLGEDPGLDGSDTGADNCHEH